jgi:hypothetical protein
MDPWRAHIRPHPYPQYLDRIAREFSPQWDDASCGLAAVRHGLLLGGLTVPEGTLGALFGRRYPDGIDLSEKTSLDRLRDLGLDPVNLTKPSRQQTHQFLEQLGHEMDRGAFALATIYDGGHWVTLGRWQGGRIRVVDSYVEKDWFRAGIYDVDMYSLTPAAFDYWDWSDGVLLIRPGIWQKNYEEWLPGRDRLLRLAGPSAPMAQRLQDAAHHYLNNEQYSYGRLEIFLSDKSRMSVDEEEPERDAIEISVSAPSADESEEKVVVVRRVAPSKPGRPRPPELICRLPRLYGWQLTLQRSDDGRELTQIQWAKIVASSPVTLFAGLVRFFWLQRNRLAANQLRRYSSVVTAL